MLVLLMISTLTSLVIVSVHTPLLFAYFSRRQHRAVLYPVDLCLRLESMHVNGGVAKANLLYCSSKITPRKWRQHLSGKGKPRQGYERRLTTTQHSRLYA